MGFIIVTPSEKLATTLYVTLEISVLLGREFTNSPRSCDGTWGSPAINGPARRLFMTFRTSIVWWDW